MAIPPLVGIWENDYSWSYNYDWNYSYDYSGFRLLEWDYEYSWLRIQELPKA